MGVGSSGTIKVTKAFRRATLAQQQRLGESPTGEWWSGWFKISVAGVFRYKEWAGWWPTKEAASTNLGLRAGYKVAEFAQIIETK